MHLRSSSLLALTKLMAIDPVFCDANLALVFTLLEKRSAIAACVYPTVASDEFHFVCGGACLHGYTTIVKHDFVALLPASQPLFYEEGPLRLWFLVAVIQPAQV